MLNRSKTHKYWNMRHFLGEETEIFSFLFLSLDSDYRVQLVPFPLFGRPTESDTYRFFRHFYRSDNYHFWENVVSFKAVMLTDTSEYRRNMDKCYHKRCDNMKQIKENDLEFLRRNVNAVIQTTLELSETGKFKKSADFNKFNKLWGCKVS